MGGDLASSLISSSEEESLLEQEFPELSLGLPPVLGDDGLSANVEDSGENGVVFGEFDDVGRRISSTSLDFKADQRRRRSVYRDVLDSYDESWPRDLILENLYEAKSKILSYIPGAWIEKVGGMKLSDYDVPNTTSLLLIGPKGSGKSSLVNRISRVFEDDQFASDRAQVSYNSSVGDGTYFLQEYMIPRGSTSFCLFDTRCLSDDSSKNMEMLKHWMTKGVRHGELVVRDSDCSTLKTRIRKLHLWPRFQVYVSQDLERDPPEVVDVRVPMSSHMKVIQKAVIEVMDACLKEMRKTNKVDVEDLTVRNGLFKSFDEIVRRQLDPIWHTLGKKTRQLVSDLKTLRKLLDYLVRYDAVTYLKYLDSLRASESFRSVWIFAESSYKIFEYAKKRVYHFGRLDGGKLVGQSKSSTTKKRKLKDTNKEKEDSLPTLTSGVALEEVLEEAPKWKVLREVLEEIKENRDKQALSREEPVIEGEEDNNGIVLVACKDERSCMQLEDCIMKGPNKVMREEWEKYLLSKVELHGLPKRNKNKKKGKDPKGFGILDGVIPTTPGQKAEASSISKQENDALLAAAAEIIKHAKKDIVVEDDPQSCVGSGGRAKGKGKGKQRKTSGSVQVSMNRDDKSDNGAAMNDKSEMFASENGGQINKTDPVVEGGFHESAPKVASSDIAVLRKPAQGVDATSFENAKRFPPVHFYALESDQHILDILKPSTIIMYHPDMAFVREIEIYKAENPTIKLKVYFLFYEDSTEVQKFEASIHRENGAFESLIRQKSLMMIPVDQDGRCLGPSSSIEPQSITSQNSLTRKAGGRKESEKEMQVIVDMREFMSSLPNVLHQKGMRIIPVTLEVGDYILSPLICVERKSIQDLFGSFASGRLYHQVETMVRYYRIPVLLIEFSQDKSFSFQSASDIGDDVTPNSIISKLSLLVLHFPRLRIVWSRSLYATAEIFASLKANQDEPDEVKAIRVGVPSEEGIVENDVRAENYNTSAVEFLRRLPGVTDSNYRAIMDGCESLAELALLPVEKLAELMGGQKAAKTLKDFLDAKYPTLL